MRMEAGIREALALVLPEEATVAQDDVINLITRTLAVQAVPLLGRLLTLPKSRHKKRKQRGNSIRIGSTRQLHGIQLLSPRRVQQQCDQSTRSRTGAVVGQQCVFELVLAHHMLRKLYVQFVLRPAMDMDREDGHHTLTMSTHLGPSPSHLNICTYCGTLGAKSFTAHDLSIVCSSAAVLSA